MGQRRLYFIQSMQQVVLVSLFFCLTSNLHAQSGTIVKGQIVNNQNKPLEGVTVSLLKLPDSVAVRVTQTTGKGDYQLANANAGRYIIKASSAGMEETYSSAFEMTDTVAGVQVDIIIMSESIYKLREVQVTGKSKLVEMKQGKTVYNVEKSITASGSSALDVLRKAPGINVDQNENILLKGSPNVNVMVDGKMTYLSAQQLTNLLKSMSAENIARIEISANPSSEFDAAGNAGIINIITRKMNRQGYAMNLTAVIGTGRYLNTSESIAGNIKVKHFNLFGSYNYYYKKSYMNRTSYRTIENGNKTIVYDRHSFDPEKTSNHNYKAGIDFYLNSNNQISIVYNGYNNTWNRDAAGPTFLKDNSGNIDSIVQNHNITHEPQHNHSYTFSYNLKIDTTGSLFSMDADYASYKSSSSGYLGNQFFLPDNSPLRPYQQLNFKQPAHITIRSARADLVHSIKKVNFKAGLKYADVRADNNSVYDSLIGNQSVHSVALSNHFIYEEKIFSGYISSSAQIKKTSINAGIRIENTASTGNSLTSGIFTNRNYTNVFPYLSVDHNLNDDNKLGLAVTRRIDRPVYANLNPFRYFFDKYSYYEGNPFLQPEFAWNTTLSYTLKDKYITQFTFSRTSQPIAEFATQDAEAGILKVTSANFSHKSNFGVMFIIPVSIGRFWEMQNTIDLLQASYRYQQRAFDIKRSMAVISTTQTIKLPKSILVELTAAYQTPSIDGVYIRRRLFTADAGIKRTLNKLEIKLAC